MKKGFALGMGSVPIVVMIALIPIIKNDLYLSGVYILIVIVSLATYREKKDVLVFCAGVVLMTVSEYFFISTGVETFVRRSLFDLMPLWLPLLWGYGFVAISRVTKMISYV